jgi:hypothetical protein
VSSCIVALSVKMGSVFMFGDQARDGCVARARQ